MPEKPTRRWARWMWLYVALLAWSLFHLRLPLMNLPGSLFDIGEYISRYRRPNLTGAGEMLRLMGQTLALSLWATWIALVSGCLLAPFAARGLAPNAWVYSISRGLLNLMRAIPDLLLAAIFVAAIGPGPLAGVLALSFHTAGFLGKSFAESMERVDGGVYQALASTGAGFSQMVMLAAWPTILREALGYIVYIFDRNVRMASVLGFVGAGGIGVPLYGALRTFDYDRASALILVILFTIVALDYLSAWIRSKLT